MYDIWERRECNNLKMIKKKLFYYSEYLHPNETPTGSHSFSGQCGWLKLHKISQLISVRIEKGLRYIYLYFLI